jgi:hypothetical protein
MCFLWATCHGQLGAGAIFLRVGESGGLMRFLWFTCYGQLGAGASIFCRDGSYGLLRRPIRYNTLLIRNTCMIRKRICRTNNISRRKNIVFGGCGELTPPEIYK